MLGFSYLCNIDFVLAATQFVSFQCKCVSVVLILSGEIELGPNRFVGCTIFQNLVSEIVLSEHHSVRLLWGTGNRVRYFLMHYIC